MLFNYIEFLLPTHNCVIIPDFGAFIVNMDTSKIKINNIITVPVYKIVLNQELKYNDGLLSSHIQKDENISYNAACLKIKNAVNDIKRELTQKKIIKCGDIGHLQFDSENNITFTANKEIIHPALYGLSSVELSRITQIEAISKPRSVKYTIANIAAASAAIFMLLTPSIRINESSNKVQQANFSYSLSKSLFKPKSNTALQVDSVVKFDISAEENNIIPQQEEEIISTIQVPPLRKYYIIVGGEESSTRANSILQKIKSDNFPNAAIIESPGRYRIYVASFCEKQEAETFLDTFRKENPKHETAWLFSKRNK